MEETEERVRETKTVTKGWTGEGARGGDRRMKG